MLSFSFSSTFLVFLKFSFAISLRMLSNTINQNGDVVVKAMGYIITLLATYALFSVVVGIASRSNDALSKSELYS